MEDELIQYFIVNKEIHMSKGKTAAQVAHVATMITLECHETTFFKEWFADSQKKIVLEGKEKDLLKLIELGFYSIRDNGLTEIPAGTLTCVGLPPMPKNIAKKYVKRLQLLKD
jgi:peptidyl-tRNA hydrolase, PTH2 family